MPDPPPIEALDAAITTWLRRGYEFGLGRRYLESLDLTSGAGLVAACEEACPWFGETVRNERDHLRLMVQRFAATNRSMFQVVLFGQDMSPFCLELLDSIPSLRAVFEVGGSDMDVKRELIYGASPKSISRLRFQVADISDPRLGSILMDEGDIDLAMEMPTVIIAENANRYSEGQLQSALRTFTAKGRNLVVLHHMLPYSDINEMGSTARALQEAFEGHCPGWRPHSVASVAALFVGSKVNSVASSGMHTIETTFPGRPIRFPSGEGWSRTSYGIL
jgi:hypothetical protein